MAIKYLVAGGTWNGSNTAIWSNTPGGAPGAPVPTSADDVVMDAASGNVTVTTASGAVCRSLDMDGFVGTFTLGAAMSVGHSTPGNNNIALRLGESTTLTPTNTFAMSFVSTSATQQFIYCQGNAIPFQPVINGTGGSYALGDAFTNTSTSVAISVTRGTFVSNGYSMTSTYVQISGTNTRTVNITDSTVTAIGGSWSATTTTGLTFTSTGSTIILLANTNFNGGGLMYNDVLFRGKSKTVTVTGSNTFRTLGINGGNTAKFTAGTTQTITGGQRGVFRRTSGVATLCSTSDGSAYTLTNAVRMVLDGFSVRDCNAAGATAHRVWGDDVSGNTNIAFPSMASPTRPSCHGPVRPSAYKLPA